MPDDAVVVEAGLEALFHLPEQGYATIVADPPWNFRDPLQRSRSTFRGAESHYPVMKLGLIASLPIGQLAKDNAHLYLWTPNAFMVEAHQIAAAWGFAVRTILTWVKPSIGMGHFFRNNTEHVLFGVRGRLPPKRRDCPTSFSFPRRGHSEKPEEFFGIVESMSPGPYLELFGRRPRPGWTIWGNEAGRFPNQLVLPADGQPEPER